MKIRSRPLLQVAVDVLSTQKALEIVGEIYPHADIIEIGTPLIIEEGLQALEAVKVKFPDKEYLADLKIMDAGRIEAASGFRRGANIVTVLAAADNSTIRRTLEVAETYGGQVMVDLINIIDPVSRARDLFAMGVPIICVHTSVDLHGYGEDDLCPLQIIRPVVSCQLAVAGGLTVRTVDQALSNGADILVVGRGITDQHYPRQVACRILKQIEEWTACSR